MTKNDYLKQKLLFPKDTSLKYCDDPGLGWGGNYSELTEWLFGNSLACIEKERIRVGIMEFEKLLDELPLLVLQAYAMRKRSMNPIRRLRKGVMSPGRLSLTQSFKVRLSGQERQMLHRGTVNAEDQDTFDRLLNDFKTSPDYCYTHNDIDGIKHTYNGRRTVLDLASRIASYRALRKVVDDTSFDDTARNNPLSIILTPTYPVKMNINEQIRFSKKSNQASLKNPRTPDISRPAYQANIETLEKMKWLSNGNPPDLIQRHFFRDISSYLWNQERFNKREIGFLLARTKVVSSCEKCRYNSPKHCPKIFISHDKELPCERKYVILQRAIANPNGRASTRKKSPLKS